MISIGKPERQAATRTMAYGNIYRYSPNYNDNIPITYTGEYLDEESGLIYLRNRYYNPSIGRFITEDTHWNPSNMIYGDKQKATKYTIIENKKVYYDDGGNVVKVKEFDDKEIAKGVDKKDNSNQTNNKLYDIQRIPQSDAITQSGNLHMLHYLEEKQGDGSKR